MCVSSDAADDMDGVDECVVAVDDAMARTCDVVSTNDDDGMPHEMSDHKHNLSTVSFC